MGGVGWFVVAGVCCVAWGAAAQVPSTPAIAPGSPYAQARAKLVAAGYKPFHVLRPGSAAYRANVFSRGDVYRLYPEVEACAGTGEGDCNMILSRGANDVLIVHTVGEEARSISVKDVRKVTAVEANGFYR